MVKKSNKVTKPTKSSSRKESSQALVAKPGVSRVDHMEGVRCGMRPFQGEVNANLDTFAIQVYAEAIIGQVNDVTGYVPKTGDPFCYGNLLMYLYQCILAYQSGTGCLVGPADNVLQFRKYSVPGWFAVLLTHTAPWTDKRSGAIFTLETSTFTYATVQALGPTEGGVNTPVITALNASLNNEPTFGPGAVVTLAATPSSVWSEISDLLHSSLPCVPVSSIALTAPSHQGIVRAVGSNAYYSLKHLPPPIAPLSLFKVVQAIGPFSTYAPIVRYPNASPSTLPAYIYWLYCHYGRKFVYSPESESKGKGTKLSAIMSLGVPNLDRFSIVLHRVNYSKFFLELVTWARRANIFTAYSASDLSFLNTLQAYWWGMTYSRAPFICRYGNASVFAKYASKNLKGAMCIPALGFQHYKPTRSDDCVYLPVFDDSTTTLTWMQSGSNLVASWGYTIGSVPLTTSAVVPAGLTLAGLPAPAAANFNVVALTLTEELERNLTQTATFVNQCIPIPSHGAQCPCDVDYTVGDNIDVVGACTIYYYVAKAISCARPIDGLACSKEICAGLMTTPEIQLWYTVIRNGNQNMVSTAIDAGYLQNNMSIFGSASSRSDPVKAIRNLYESNLKSELTEKVMDLTGSTLLRMAKDYLSEGGEPVPVPDSFLSNLDQGIRNLTPTIAGIAGLLGTMTVAGRRVLSAYRAVRVRTEEL